MTFNPPTAPVAPNTAQPATFQADADAFAAWMAAFGSAINAEGGLLTLDDISHGSNSNGEFVRLPDGTQICWNNSIANQSVDTPIGGIFGAATEETWLFPAAFFATPTVLPGRGGSSVGTRWVGFGTPNSTGVEVRALGAVQSSAELSIGAMAIGRWF